MLIHGCWLKEAMFAKIKKILGRLGGAVSSHNDTIHPFGVDVLTPDTTIAMLFEDTKGLVETLRERPNCVVGYVEPQYLDHPMPPESRCQWVLIGSRLPFTEIKSVLVEALTRYKGLKYYSVSNDHRLRHFCEEFELAIGIETKGAKKLGISPIESTEMLKALETYQTTEELLTFIRSRYQDDYKTFEIEPIPVTTYHPVDVGAAPAPISARPKYISGSEQLAAHTVPATFNLVVRLYVESLDDFLEQLPEVEPMLYEWIGVRGDKIKEFCVCVGAEGPLQKIISDWIDEAYNEGALFANVPDSLTIFVLIDNRANDSKLYYELNRS